ncbi:MAG: hypothetical protein ABWW70_03425 [Thermoproteota archaeon]
MPVVYRCGVCGFILHIFVKVGQNSYGVPTPSEVISQFGGMCPRCGSELRRPGVRDVAIKPNGLVELARVLHEARATMRIRFRFVEKVLEQLYSEYPEIADLLSEPTAPVEEASAA